MNTEESFELQLQLKASWPKDNIHFHQPWRQAAREGEVLPNREGWVAPEGPGCWAQVFIQDMCSPGVLLCGNSYNANLCTFTQVFNSLDSEFYKESYLPLQANVE